MRFEYAPAPESASIVDIRSSYGLFVGGEFTVSVRSDALFDSFVSNTPPSESAVSRSV